MAVPDRSSISQQVTIVACFLPLSTAVGSAPVRIVEFELLVSAAV
jgi:hypothetical protein